MPDPTEKVLEEIRNNGYEVALGTKGYQIHIIATDSDGWELEAIDNDTYLAALQIIEQIKNR